MILLDYSAVAIANIAVALHKDKEELTEFFVLHMILNSIRKSYKKNKGVFGDMVICCDSSTNWRKTVFDAYKYKRRKDKKSSDIDWDFIYHHLEYTKEALRDGFPFKLIEVPDCEADDVIGTLARYSTENQIDTVIISNDKDFVQCHSDYVSQWRPISESYMRHENPELQLKELIIRGDRDDGVPNIKSPDDIFKQEGKRQKPIYKKEVDIWLRDDDNTFLNENAELKDNFARNKLLIDLEQTPMFLQQRILESYNAQANTKPNMGKMTQFFMKHHLRYLHEHINDFM